MNKNWLIIIFGLSGMAALIYEIIWIRPLSLVFGSTVYAVSTIISSFILGLAIGSWLAGKYTDRMKNPLKFFAMLQIGIGIFGISLLPIFGFLPNAYLELYHLTFPNIFLFQIIQILLSMGMITIPATMMGTTLPLMIKVYSKDFSSIGSDVGKLDASNSMGAVFGTLAAGFLMLPLLGITTSILVTALINFSIGIVLLARLKFIKTPAIIGIIIIIVAIWFFVPGYDAKTLNYGVYATISPILTSDLMADNIETQEILFYKESMYSSITVFSDKGNSGLTINGKIQCLIAPANVKAMSVLSVIPYELHVVNHGNPTNALVVGLGCGTNSKWFSEKLDTTTIEIDPAVIEASNFFYQDIKHTLITDDARNWLLRNDEKFDIIMAQPQDPYENNGSLFTKEYFAIVKSRLSDTGIFSQWVPLFEMSIDDWYVFFNTFHSVFPNVYVFKITQGGGVDEIVLIGSANPLETDEQPTYLGNHERFNPIATELNTDDHNFLEFSTSLNQYKQFTKQFTNASLG